MDKQKDIFICCTRLDIAGGIERMVVTLANLLSRKGHNVSILITSYHKTIFYEIDDSIKTYTLDLSFGIHNEGNIISRKYELLRNILTFRSILIKHQPGIVISTEYPIACARAAALLPKNIKTLSWEHHVQSAIKKNIFWRIFSKYAYTRIDAIICLNAKEQKCFPTLLNCQVIPNFTLNHSSTYYNINETRRKKQILSVGHLTKLKGIDLLLKVANEILTKNTDWKWILVGDGPLQAFVEDFILNNALHEHLILLKPITNDLTDLYLQSSFYAHTSHSEAFPLVLVEAMSNGTPCVAFDCPTGPAEIIQPGDNGFLIPLGDTNAYCNAVQMLIDNEEMRQKMGRNAFSSSKRFTPDAIYPLWEKLLADL